MSALRAARARLTLGEGVDDQAEGGEGLVDVGALLEAVARRPRLAVPLAARKIHQRQPADLPVTPGRSTKRIGNTVTRGREPTNERISRKFKNTKREIEIVTEVGPSRPRTWRRGRRRSG